MRRHQRVTASGRPPAAEPAAAPTSAVVLRDHGLLPAAHRIGLEPGQALVDHGGRGDVGCRCRPPSDRRDHRQLGRGSLRMCRATAVSLGPEQASRVPRRMDPHPIRAHVDDVIRPGSGPARQPASLSRQRVTSPYLGPRDGVRTCLHTVGRCVACHSWITTSRPSRSMAHTASPSSSRATAAAPWSRFQISRCDHRHLRPRSWRKDRLLAATEHRGGGVPFRRDPVAGRVGLHPTSGRDCRDPGRATFPSPAGAGRFRLGWWESMPQEWRSAQPSPE